MVAPAGTPAVANEQHLVLHELRSNATLLEDVSLLELRLVPDNENIMTTNLLFPLGIRHGHHPRSSELGAVDGLEAHEPENEREPLGKTAEIVVSILETRI